MSSFYWGEYVAFSWFTVGKHKAVYCCQANPNIPTIPIPQPPLPLSATRLDPYGGTQEFFYQTEIEFNLVAEAQIKGVLYDIGEAEDAIRVWTSTPRCGLWLQMVLPIGPLRFEWGFPLDLANYPQYGTAFSNFEFSIGSPF